MRVVSLLTTFLLLLFYSCGNQAKIVHIKQNTPSQSQFKESNTKYGIYCVIDLCNDTVTIPANSTIEFGKNGMLTNGVVIGNNTLIVGNPHFDKIRLKGHFQNKEFYTSWCSSCSMSDFIEDVMNLSYNTAMIVDSDITLNNENKYIHHLTLYGNNKTVTNSDRYIITCGNTEISNLKFRWNEYVIIEPVDSYCAVVVYHDLLEKDTTVYVRIENVDADGGKYCSYFMRQYKSKIDSKLQTDNRITNCVFKNFTRGAIWTCGGCGKICSSSFIDIGYDKSKNLYGVAVLKLGYNHRTIKGRAFDYLVEECVFDNIVAAYNLENDGRELHGLLAYGDSIVIRNNIFSNLSTSFSKSTDTGMDSEILYIKGSYNIIENNTFENGAGSASDGVVTLKSSMTEGNVVRNNRFITTNTVSKFIYLDGYNHIIEGNNFVNTYSVSRDNSAYAIYLGHHDLEGNRASVVIRDNTFSFSDKANYMAIYANKWGDLTITNNKFYNPTKLLKCNKRKGNVIIQYNDIILENVTNDTKDSFIMVLNDNGIPVKIHNNVIYLCHSVLGQLVNGSNYKFCENKIVLRSSFLEVLFRFANMEGEILNNAFSIDETTTISKNALIDKNSDKKIRVSGNEFDGRVLIINMN